MFEIGKLIVFLFKIFYSHRARVHGYESDEERIEGQIYEGDEEKKKLAFVSHPGKDLKDSLEFKVIKHRNIITQKYMMRKKSRI